MTSNKSSRHTNQGYLVKQNRAQLHPKSRSITTQPNQNNQSRPIESKQKLISIHTKNTANKKVEPQPNFQHKKQPSQNSANTQKQLNHKLLVYSQESQEEDSEYEYSFNNNNHLGKGQKVASSSKNFTANNSNPTSKPLVQQQKGFFSVQKQRQMQQRIELLQLSLKQAYYQNELLRQKLYQSEHNYSFMNQDYQQLKHSYQALSAQVLLSKQQNQTQSQQNKFITECQQEIAKLKTLVNQLTEQKYRLQLSQAPSQREEIKDRIIMKLEDQLITVKLLLQEEKVKTTQKSKDCSGDYYLKEPLNEITTNYTNRYSVNDYSAHKKTRLTYD